MKNVMSVVVAVLLSIVVTGCTGTESGARIKAGMETALEDVNEEQIQEDVMRNLKMNPLANVTAVQMQATIECAELHSKGDMINVKKAAECATKIHKAIGVYVDSFEAIAAK